MLISNGEESLGRQKAEGELEVCHTRRPQGIA